jgi:pyrroline-5-carboxylate reductase
VGEQGQGVVGILMGKPVQTESQKEEIVKRELVKIRERLNEQVKNLQKKYGIETYDEKAICYMLDDIIALAGKNKEIVKIAVTAQIQAKKMKLYLVESVYKKLLSELEK